MDMAEKFVKLDKSYNQIFWIRKTKKSVLESLELL